MLQYRHAGVALLLKILLAGLALAVQAKHDGAAESLLLIEAEDFQFPGGWMAVGDAEALSRKYLMPDGADQRPPDAMTAVAVPRTGQYQVWARSKDYPDYLPGVRRFKLAVDGKPLDKELGAHGDAGWSWELVGTLPLEQGDHMLALQFTKSIHARCDAVLLTTSTMDPNRTALSRLKAARVRPRLVATRAASAAAAPPGLRDDAPGRELARLDNGRLRIRFSAGVDETGAAVVARRAEVRVGKSWLPLAAKEEVEWVFVLQSKEPVMTFHEGKPRWRGHGPALAAGVGQRTYEVHSGGDDPFAAGAMAPLVAREVRQTDAGGVELTYTGPGGQQAIGRWTLKPERHDVGITLSVQPREDGHYSVGACGFGGYRREEIDFVQLPPLYQFQRLPDRPLMVTSSFTPHPIALAQVRCGESHPVCVAVVGEPSRLPMRWPTAQNPVYGFSLLGPTQEVQPSIFSPVLGLEGSQWTAGRTYQVAWRLLAYPGKWADAMQYVSSRIMEVQDYRKPVGVSMTQAALNMIDLMRHPEASGWDDELKGFYNIEMESTVTHAAPLAIVEAAVLGRDEKLFVERALPTIEYTLTRPDAHTARPSQPERGLRRLAVPTRFYGTSYWQGLDLLLGRLNPWLRRFALPDGKPYHARGYNGSPRWSELLAAYRLQPSEALLAEIRGEADEFLASQLFGRHREPVSFLAFYNISFYPYWWDLVDLYELTGEKRYLQAAEEGAFHTIAGLWSHPAPADGAIAVHPGGQYEGTATLWWKGDERYRLGLPRRPGDTPQREVPAWQVSQLGLGLEQPCTFFTPTKNHRHILMSAWSPHLLRLFEHTGRDLFRTYARNSIIGRFANYNGYYLMGYTDVVHQPQYPYRGPDVTSLYYHHIPPQLAFTLDYLVAQASCRSGGRIHFPWAKQQNYAWFTNRVYGPEPGEIYGEKGASLWLDGRAVHIASADVDWLAARGPHRFWLVLMSQADKPLTISPELDTERIGLKPGTPVRRHEGDRDEAIELPAGSLKTVALPPKGIVVLSMAAEPRDQLPDLPPLEQGHAVREVDGDWGQLHVFRIRTPFGADAIYAALTGGAEAGATVSLLLNGRAQPDDGRFPYEFSAYPWPPAEAAEIQVEIRSPDGTFKRVEGITMPGT